jgi:3-hydroxypropanoate dehydrogenase
VERVIDDAGLDLLYRQARTHRSWTDRPVSDTLLQAAYELARMGPTSGNCCPMRIVFVVSAAAKQRLLPCLEPGNLRQTETAPVTAIVANDSRFFEEFPTLSPRLDPVAFAAQPAALLAELALRNGSL